MWISQGFVNPITFENSKCDRQITWNGANLTLKVCQDNDFDHPRTTDFEYYVNGVANYYGDAQSGHYICHIRNQNIWSCINNENIRTHNNLADVTLNLAAIFASLVT